jgi:hypothetical protein
VRDVRDLGCADGTADGMIVRRSARRAGIYTKVASMQKLPLGTSRQRGALHHATG